jgi:hypothetical protein
MSPQATEDETIAAPRVVCAALRHEEGAIICGPRHFDATMMAQISAQGGDWRRAEQGFVDQFGRFLTRDEAWDIAKARDQLLPNRDGILGTLYSEDLY